MTKVHDNATDIITFARSSSGTALRRVGYGENLVTNGDFATGDLTGWTVIGSDATHSVTYSSGGLRYQSDTTSPVLYFEQNGILEIGKLYQITVETTAYTSGSLKTDNFTSTQVVSAGLGAVTFTGIASSTTFTILRNSSNVDITIDNISVKEVFLDRATDDLVLFDHPDDIPRIEYGSDGSLKGLLIEEQRTNLFPSSNDFETWAEQTPSGPTTGFRHIQENAAIGPDGQTSAHKLVESTDFDLQRIYRAFSGMTANTDYTYSVFLKAGERTEAYVRTTETSGMLVDLSDGTFTVSGGSNHAVQPVGNNWYRCSLTVNETGTTVVPWVSIRSGGSASYTGDGTSGIYVYGAQFEAGSFPTSYIPTSGSTVTRSLDLASIPVSAFGYNQDAGTVVVESTYEGLDAARLGRYLEFNGTSPATDRILIYRSSSNNTKLQLRNGGVDSVGFTNTNTPIGDANVTAAAYKTNSANLCTNGTLNTVDTSVVVPGDMTTLDIGSASSARSDTGKVYIKSIQYYPRRLTDAQLQKLTG